MKKLKSILLIVFCFLVLTAFVTVKGRAEANGTSSDDIINVIDNSNKENKQKEENTANLLNGYRGKYEFKDSEVFEGKNGNKILVLNVEYTNTTDSATFPLFSFYLDTAITQDVDGTMEPIEKSNIIFDNKINKEDIKVQPGQKVSILVPIELKSNSGNIYIKDLMSNGDKFTKIIEL